MTSDQKIEVVSKMLQGSLAWIGVWVCFCAIADYVIVIEENAWAMAFGVLAKIVADHIEEWVSRPKS